MACFNCYGDYEGPCCGTDSCPMYLHRLDWDGEPDPDLYTPVQEFIQYDAHVQAWLRETTPF